LTDDSRFGFIVLDGNGALFGTLQGNSREVITKFSVDLPKKHGRGGQSALRFARLRMEKRHNYLRKVAETAVQCFIADDKVNVSGLILAGLADFKTELHQSDMFDPVSHNGRYQQARFTPHLLASSSKSAQTCRCLVRWREWFQSSHRTGCRNIGRCQVHSGEEIDR
jgi:hypothetical protein